MLSFLGEDALEKVGIGVIGCGNISAAYLKAAAGFPILDVRALADINPAAAEARGAEFGIPARSVDDLLADPEIEIVVNLTVPLAHVEVGLRAIEAGKHVHSEKPLAITTAEARPLLEAARRRDASGRMRAGHLPRRRPSDLPQADRRQARSACRSPAPRSSCRPGHERWHPNPGFYYLPGGGPMFDMGPYYITDLVNLLGPVGRVAGIASRVRAERLITSEPLQRNHDSGRRRHPRRRHTGVRRRARW